MINFKEYIAEKVTRDHQIIEATRKKIGSAVTVTKGRFKGKTGVVRQINKGRYGNPGETRLDIDFDDGTEGVVDPKDVKLQK